jgi:prepilin-type N-terminal cleavage/methylation domain-containing protein
VAQQNFFVARPARPVVKCFTLIELLVVVAIIAILASMLLPALSRARYTAMKSSCQSQMKQMGMGLSLYGSDFDDFMPLQAVNSQDYTIVQPNPRGGCVAGRQIWGLGQGSTATGPNKAMGMGNLVVLNYIPLDLLYCPTVKSGTWWDRRVHFGAPWSAGFTDVKGNPWTSGGYVSGSNYYMDSDYAYRSGDWSTTTQERRNSKYARSNHSEFPDHALLMDGNATNHLQIFGANVMWGDLSVSWWRDNLMYSYTLSGAPTYPTTTTFHGFFLIYLMDTADQNRNR